MTLKKINLLITLLFVTIAAATTQGENHESFSIENVWKNSTSSSEDKPNWINGLQRYYDDVIAVLRAYPNKFSGQEDLVIPSMQAFLSKLVTYSNSNSKILSSGANEILYGLSQIKIDSYSAQGLINEFDRTLPIVTNVYRGVVTNLTAIIGNDLVSAVNGDLTDTERTFERYMEAFNTGDGNGLKIEIDYEPVMKCVQTLTNTISLKGEASLSESQLANPEVQDALVVLSLVLEPIVLCTHGLKGSYEVVLFEQECKASQSC